MQHHGLPTRLLDWTMQPLAALFFALDFNDKQKRAITPVVWVMNPYALNKLTQGRDFVFVPSTNFGPQEDVARLDSYLPECLRPLGMQPGAVSGEFPMAIEPTFSNRRLIAQQGCFTIHGRGAMPINKLPGMQPHLKCISVDRDYVSTIRVELEQLGFRGEWLYQDLDRLCRRIVTERQN